MIVLIASVIALGGENMQVKNTKIKMNLDGKAAGDFSCPGTALTVKDSLELSAWVISLGEA